MSTRLGELVARNIQAERARSRWTQRDLGTRIGLSQPALSQIENGRRRIDVDELLALCDALQVPLSRLLVGASREQLRVLGLPSGSA
jgi:transcriptional regulator with XRE-family HTH domain